MKRHRHRWATALVVFVLAFSQVVVAAYACPIVAAVGSASFTEEAKAAPMADCAEMPAPDNAGANVCEAHCLVGQQVHNSDATPVPVALLSPLFVRVATKASSRGALIGTPDPPAARTPAHVRFNRLLI